MKTKKIKLENLKIESFVTKLNAGNALTVNGGKGPLPGDTHTAVVYCENSLNLNC